MLSITLGGAFFGLTTHAATPALLFPSEVTESKKIERDGGR